MTNEQQFLAGRRVFGPVQLSPQQPWNLGVFDSGKRIFRGAAPAKRCADPESALQWLAGQGVQTVLILNKSEQGIDVPAEVAWARSLGMEVRQVDWDGLLHEKREGQRHLWETVAALFDKGHVYVHCVWGVDRTGAVIARARMELQGWSSLEAFRELRSHGFAFELKASELQPYQMDVLDFFDMDMRNYEPLRPGHLDHEACPVRVPTAIG